MPFKIIRHDITKMKVDAIVNAANTDLLMGGGVCGAIFKAAGSELLALACQPLAPIETGQAVITSAFNLPAKMIIHTAGPIYKDGHQNEAYLLEESYLNSLNLAYKNHCQSIAFPLISSGIYGYPTQEALEIATKSIQTFLLDHEMDVTLVIFDTKSTLTTQSLMGEIQQFIDSNYTKAFETLERFRNITQDDAFMPKDFTLDISFSDYLFNLIDEKQLDEISVYKSANISRKLFSKIRNTHYTPSKRTILALAISMKLNRQETNRLLNQAGYSLSPSVLFDVIIDYFILHRIYDIYTINEVLFDYDQPLLGS